MVMSPGKPVPRFGIANNVENLVYRAMRVDGRYFKVVRYPFSHRARELEIMVRIEVESA